MIILNIVEKSSNFASSTNQTTNETKLGPSGNLLNITSFACKYTAVLSFHQTNKGQNDKGREKTTKTDSSDAPRHESRRDTGDCN